MKASRTPLRLLLAEDNPDDADLILRELRKAGFEPEWTRVETEPAFLSALEKQPEIILSDYAMPKFGGLRALELLRASGRGIPFILISGTVGEEVAVAAMRLGATDYLIKDRIARLPGAVEHALLNQRLGAERKQTEQALQASELSRKLREEALEAMSQGVLLADAARKIIYSNPAFTRLTGYPAEEIIGRNCALLQGPETNQGGVQAIRDALKRGEVFEGELLNYRKDGTTFWNHLSVTPVFDEAKRVTNFIGIQQDVTARRATEEALRTSEQRFRQIAETIREVFWVRDPMKNEILYISPAYETIWGRPCSSMLANSGDWMEAVHPDDRERVAAAAQQAKGDYDEVFRILRTDGATRWVNARSFPIKDDRGEVYRIIGTASDITQQRKMEDQFRQAQKLEAVGTLAAGIAHDFNNILGAIIGYTELTKLCVQDAVPQRYLDAVLQGSQRAAALVRQILAFSRQQEQQRMPVTLGKAIEEPVQLLRATIPSTIQFDVDLSKDTPPVLADPTQIHQVVMNLCTNAAHAMKDRNGRLEVKLDNFHVDEFMAKTYANLHPGPYVRLTVRDTGCGMSADTLQHIFEPFFTTKGPGEGTGLGLAAVHGIMRSHDGEIAVYSQPGEGTVFHLYFPVYGADASAVTVSSETIPAGRGGRILFVDDEQTLAALGGVMLESLGYAVSVTTKPQEVIERVRADPSCFDLIITDLTMPLMTGMELAEQILKIRPGAPIILTTGNMAGLTPERIKSMGVSDLLLKPLTRAVLGKAIHRALGREDASLSAGQGSK